MQKENTNKRKELSDRISVIPYSNFLHFIITIFASLGIAIAIYTRSTYWLIFALLLAFISIIIFVLQLENIYNIKNLLSHIQFIKASKKTKTNDGSTFKLTNDINDNLSNDNDSHTNDSDIQDIKQITIKKNSTPVILINNDVDTTTNISKNENNDITKPLRRSLRNRKKINN